MLQYHMPYEKITGNVKASTWFLDNWLKGLPPAKVVDAKATLSGLAIIGIDMRDLARVFLTARNNDLAILVGRSDGSVVKIVVTPSCVG